MQSNYNTHLIKVIALLVMLGLAVVGAQVLFVPSDFGKYGHYRSGAIEDEMNRPVRYMTNDSCLACHEHEKEIHLAGVHKTVSCEFCHGPYADHIKDGKKIGALPVRRGEELKTLCLRCHNKVIQARPTTSIKVIAMPEHLEEKKVRLHHNCDQCHHVHAPLKHINAARKITGMEKKKEALK